MTDLNSTLADMRARVDHGVYAGPWAIDHLPTVFGLYDAGMAYRGEGTVLLGSAFQPNVANRIVTDHNDLPKLLAAVEAVVAVHSPVRKGDENWNPDTMVARRVYCLGCEGEFDWPTEYKDCPTIRALESALGVSDDPQNQ